MAVNASKDVTPGIHSNKTYTFSPIFFMMPIKKIHYKRFELVKMLQIEFDMIDFTYLYVLYMWNFLSSLWKKMVVSFSNHARHAVSQLQ